MRRTGGLLETGKILYLPAAQIRPNPGQPRKIFDPAVRGLRDACKAPLFQLSLDNDWDETAWSRLRSFLYYC